MLEPGLSDSRTTLGMFFEIVSLGATKRPKRRRTKTFGKNIRTISRNMHTNFEPIGI